jgi:hypothetical protein
MGPWRRSRGSGDTPRSTAKRRHERYFVNTRLLAVMEDEDRTSGVHGRALDVSESGVGGIFDEAWALGSRINLEISLPAIHSPLKLKAIVRHCTGTKFRYGFEFIDVSAEQQRILGVACKFLATRKSIPPTDLR